MFRGPIIDFLVIKDFPLNLVDSLLDIVVHFLISDMSIKGGAQTGIFHHQIFNVW